MREILGRISAGDDLSMDEMATVINAVMQGLATEEQIALFLTALRAKGATVDEVAGAALAMRQHMTPIRTQRTNLVDTCGTGGAKIGIFNISTAAALVAAAAGAPVAKHGNRRMSGTTGSADVLSELGVNIEAPVAVVERCLEELGICFCFAQLLHRSMKHVAPVRRKLGVHTIFNLLGPLCNPAGAPFQVLGVAGAEVRQLLAGALVKLGTQRAVVVHGEDGLCEITLDGRTRVTEVRAGKLHEFFWTPLDFGLEPSDKTSMLVDGPPASAAIIRRILAGERGPARDIVLANAAAALWISGSDQTLTQCVRRAADAIDSGAARGLLAQLVEVSNA